jgi:hypothetical protein
MSNETQTNYQRLLAGLENSRWDYMKVLADAAEEVELGAGPKAALGLARRPPVVGTLAAGRVKDALAVLPKEG